MSLLAEQTEYYRARAAEYDEWWQRRGRYDRGAEATERWRAEVQKVEAALDDANLSGHVLELACGTGWWTERLARTATSLTCIDASPEMIAINRSRLGERGVPVPSYEVADLFAWKPKRQYDAIFFSFWLSHVPNDRFDAFWDTAREALRPGGRLFFIDSAPDATATAHNHDWELDGVQLRKLNDGRSFRIVKRFYDPAELGERLARLGWVADIRKTDTYFIFGEARHG